MMSELPARVVAEDKRLDRAATSASEELARLRWHWTLDESNPERVSLSEYARAVGRARSIISRDANAYVLLRRGTATALTDARERANMGAETEAATEAVANARGVSMQQARKARPTEVKRVRDMARERVEQQGGTIEEQAEKAADWIVRSEKAERRRTADRNERLGLRFVELEAHLEAARRRLGEALEVARAVDWEDEHQELLRHTLGQVKALLTLIDVALAGVADVDWDAELAALEGGNRDR